MGEPQYDMQDVIIADLAQQLAQSRVEVERLKVIESEHLRVGGGWRCFHCGVWFLDETAARAHFQDRTDNPADQKPAWCCQALDRAEARLAKVVELHARCGDPGEAPWCSECIDDDGNGASWPCPTFAAAHPEEESHG